MADDWVHAGADRDVPLSGPWPEVVVDEQAIALVRDNDGTIHAVRSRCPHLAAPMTGATVVEDGLECSRHFYTYDLETGRNTVPGDATDEALPVHEVEIRNGQVWVRRQPVATTPTE